MTAERAQDVSFRIGLEDENGAVRPGDVVRGFQIGRYAVVAVPNTTYTQSRTGDVYVGGHLVAHWESGAVIARAADFQDGCWLADYISAFGPDVEGKDAGTVHAAVVAGTPSDVIEYLTTRNWPARGMPGMRPSFLTWRAERAAGNFAGPEPDAGSAPAEG